ncbi:hypothetical protein [Mycobacteroides sp. CBMA 271]|uniref:hypothetical protein n=1 Tax=Mycobacteroides sp. CBMA 271 TaxID=2606608 RepID=UPI001FB7FCD2|nr:hypothetical protein [Mycobacteroides sp. CBMA 271]
MVPSFGLAVAVGVLVLVVVATGMVDVPVLVAREVVGGEVPVTFVMPVLVEHAVSPATTSAMVMVACFTLSPLLSQTG